MILINLKKESYDYDIQPNVWKFDAAYLSSEQRLEFIKAYNSKEEVELEICFWEGTIFAAPGVVSRLAPSFEFKLSKPSQIGHRAKRLTKVAVV